jgi:hypothetical protein
VAQASAAVRRRRWRAARSCSVHADAHNQNARARASCPAAPCAANEHACSPASCGGAAGVAASRSSALRAASAWRARSRAALHPLRARDRSSRRTRRVCSVPAPAAWARAWPRALPRASASPNATTHRVRVQSRWSRWRSPRRSGRAWPSWMLAQAARQWWP